MILKFTGRVEKILIGSISGVKVPPCVADKRAGGALPNQDYEVPFAMAVPKDFVNKELMTIIIMD